MMNAVIYVHGKDGSASESEHYIPLFPDRFVFGLDYKTFSPIDTGKEVRDAVSDLKSKYGDVILIANSMGAYFSLNAGINGLVSRAFFISPLVDMMRMICDIMKAEGVSADELQRKGVVSTRFGTDLTWDHYCYEQNRKTDWTIPTDVLYGGCDELIPRETVEEFCRITSSALTVMPDGEHWFHTPEQMKFLDDWMTGALKK